jgi:hypothetical protein
VFTPDGNSLLSPVGNKVTCFDLVKFVMAPPESLEQAQLTDAIFSAISLSHSDSNTARTLLE